MLFLMNLILTLKENYSVIKWLGQHVISLRAKMNYYEVILMEVTLIEIRKPNMEFHCKKNNLSLYF